MRTVMIAACISLLYGCAAPVEKEEITLSGADTIADTTEKKPYDYLDTGIVRSVVDGVVWKDKVNLWSSTDGNTRYQVGSVMPGTKVYLKSKKDGYHMIVDSNDEGNRGYVLEGWVDYDAK